MRPHNVGLVLTVAAVLSGCVSIPVGPAVAVMPGPAKTAEQFRVDDADCRNYAQNANSSAVEAATNNAAGAAAAGTVMGAVTGAIIGAAAGDAGAGAAIGAGTGLLWGSAASAPGYSSYQLQRRYDTYYAQCMYARGHQFPGRVNYRAAPYPPPNTPAPAWVPAPAGAATAPNAPPPGYYPPPGTPAPAAADSGTRGRVTPAPVNPPPTYPPAGTPPPGTPAPGIPPPGTPPPSI
jgi:uncharacterized protein YcfJ